MNWKQWLHTLVAYAIGGAATALSAAAVMPATFNFTHDGLVNLGKIAFAGAWYPVLTFLKQSPLPTSTETVTTTATVTQEVTKP
jgi:hypothetical protein